MTRKVVKKARKRANTRAWRLRHGIDVFPGATGFCAGDDNHVSFVGVIIGSNLDEIPVRLHAVQTMSDLPGDARTVPLRDRRTEGEIFLIFEVVTDPPTEVYSNAIGSVSERQEGAPVDHASGRLNGHPCRERWWICVPVLCDVNCAACISRSMNNFGPFVARPVRLAEACLRDRGTKG